MTGNKFPPPPVGTVPAATSSGLPAPAQRVPIPVPANLDPAAKAALDKTQSDLMLAKQHAAAAAAKAAELDKVVQDKDRQLAAITAKN